MKTIILFYGQDGSAAKDAAAQLRNRYERYRPIHAEICFAPQRCDAIVFMPDVPDYERRRLTSMFADIPTSEYVVPAPVITPLPGALPDPVTKLPDDWKTSVSGPELMKVASAQTGRAVDNQEQAAAIIETSLNGEAK